MFLDSRVIEKAGNKMRIFEFFVDTYGNFTYKGT
jgi:hypothetical protein